MFSCREWEKYNTANPVKCMRRANEDLLFSVHFDFEKKLSRFGYGSGKKIHSLSNFLACAIVLRKWKQNSINLLYIFKALNMSSLFMNKFTYNSG